MTITFREGTSDDVYTTFMIFRESIIDFGVRMNIKTIDDSDDPEVIQQMWEKRRGIFEHITSTSDRFWLAERNGKGVGYARTIMRDGVRQLTEFFVVPGVQSRGVGGELLRRAFPAEGARHRTIIATIDSRARARYLKAGVYPRTPIYDFSREPRMVDMPSTDLTFMLTSEIDDVPSVLAKIDKAVLGFRRHVDHEWLQSTRDCYVYLRDGQPVGYGYLAPRSGPFALLNPADFPAILAHAEREAVKNDRSFRAGVPLINQNAVDYLLENGFRMHDFTEFFMTDTPFGRFDSYIFPSPQLFT